MQNVLILEEFWFKVELDFMYTGPGYMYKNWCADKSPGRQKPRFFGQLGQKPRSLIKGEDKSPGFSFLFFTH